MIIDKIDSNDHSWFPAYYNYENDDENDGAKN